MIIDQKLLLIKKLYGNVIDLNYFFNPFYPRKKVTINILKNKWGKLYRKDINHLTHFYIHTPFCLEKCDFCQYYSGFKIKDKDTIDDYLKYLEKYILEFSNILRGKNFGGLYFGGGTASIYSEKQLERLLKVIFDNISFNGEYLKEFELHPVTTTFKKLEILKKYGIDRITFGIQSFNKETLKKENRLYCSPNRVKRLIDYSKKLGFKSISVDLIIGLNNEKIEDISYTLEEVLKIKPYTIRYYTLQSNKEKSILYNGSIEKYYERIREIYKILINKYFINSDYKYKESLGNINFGKVFNLKGFNDSNKKTYDTHVNNIESVFSIGYGSYSHIFGLGKYYIPNDLIKIEHMKINYEKLTELDEKNIFLSRFIQDGEIRLNFFKKKYSENFISKNKKIIDFLIKINKIKIIGNKIIFITNNVKENYIYGLLFFDLKFILHHALYIDKNFKK